jgi:hypothetical protein
MWTMSIGNFARKWYRRASSRLELAMSDTIERQAPPSPNFDLLLRAPDKYSLFRHYRPLD